MIDGLLTVTQAADRLKEHLRTVYRWVSQGCLQAKRLPGGGLRIEAKGLEKLLGQNTTRTRAKPRGGTGAKPGK